ncbi:hypothetical protein THAOC_18020 [Thalassiosira oceanica]|uniref:Uncharacterized protein n=1 Tax=Thalassiosira oceanica TaxID=159749 RepID=K0S968_THAOC|nr:hypothetical protein THAOC_18020 [Thalassiosira oceanica]|eukprot:EJK61484.1 hypothetical protein THAOC_18020 [Thalassiosira oceanica]
MSRREQRRLHEDAAPQLQGSLTDGRSFPWVFSSVFSLALLAAWRDALNESQRLETANGGVLGAVSWPGSVCPGTEGNAIARCGLSPDRGGGERSRACRSNDGAESTPHREEHTAPTLSGWGGGTRRQRSRGLGEQRRFTATHQAHLNPGGSIQLRLRGGASGPIDRTRRLVIRQARGEGPRGRALQFPPGEGAVREKEGGADLGQGVGGAGDGGEEPREDDRRGTRGWTAQRAGWWASPGSGTESVLPPAAPASGARGSVRLPNPSWSEKIAANDGIAGTTSTGRDHTRGWGASRSPNERPVVSAASGGGKKRDRESRPGRRPTVPPASPPPVDRGTRNTIAGRTLEVALGPSALPATERQTNPPEAGLRMRQSTGGCLGQPSRWGGGRRWGGGPDGGSGLQVWEEDGSAESKRDGAWKMDAVAAIAGRGTAAGAETRDSGRGFAGPKKVAAAEGAGRRSTGGRRPLAAATFADGGEGVAGSRRGQKGGPNSLGTDDTLPLSVGGGRSPCKGRERSQRGNKVDGPRMYLGGASRARRVRCCGGGDIALSVSRPPFERRRPAPLRNRAPGPSQNERGERLVERGIVRPPPRPGPPGARPRLLDLSLKDDMRSTSQDEGADSSEIDAISVTNADQDWMALEPGAAASMFKNS